MRRNKPPRKWRKKTGRNACDTALIWGSPLFLTPATSHPPASLSLLKNAKATPSRHGLHFLNLLRFRLRLGWLDPITAHMKELLHFAAFIPAFVGFIRAIRHLSERVLGVANHLEHGVHRFSHSDLSFLCEVLKREERQRQRRPQFARGNLWHLLQSSQQLSGDLTFYLTQSFKSRHLISLIGPSAKKSRHFPLLPALASQSFPCPEMPILPLSTLSLNFFDTPASGFKDTCL